MVGRSMVSRRKVYKATKKMREKDADALKLLEHFLKLHYERSQIIDEVDTKSNYGNKQLSEEDMKDYFYKMRRNVEKDAVILKLLERDLKDVKNDLDDVLITLSKVNNINEQTLEDTLFLKKLVDNVKENMHFLKDKHERYIKHKTNFQGILEAIKETHHVEKKHLRKLLEEFSPVKIERLKKDYAKAEQILSACKNDEKKLAKLLQEYHAQNEGAKDAAFYGSYALPLLIAAMALFGDDSGPSLGEVTLALTIVTAVGTTLYFLQQLFQGERKLYQIMEREAEKDTKM